MYLCNIYNKSKYNDYITIVLTYSDTNPAFFFFFKKNCFLKAVKNPHIPMYSLKLFWRYFIDQSKEFYEQRRSKFL